MKELSGKDTSSVLGDLTKLILQSDPRDDIYDRMSCAVSVSIFVLLVIFTGSALNFGNPIECIYTAEFPEPWTEYYNDRCYVEGTYSSKVPDDPMLEIYNGAEIETREIQYYQWVPYVLLLQALMFLVPKCVWKLCVHMQNFDFMTTVSEAKKLRHLIGKKRREHKKTLIRHIIGDADLTANRALFGRSLSTCHVLVKWLYFLNASFQYYALTRFVGGDNFMWAIEGLLENFNRKRSPVFPLDTMCELRFEQAFNEQRRIFQCVLPWNLINEKIFIFLWFWLVFVVFMAGFSAVTQTALFLVSRFRYKAIVNLLEASPKLKAELNSRAVRHFSANVINSDGVLLLGYIKQQAGSIVAGQITYDLWRNAMGEQMDESANETLAELHPVASTPRMEGKEYQHLLENEIEDNNNSSGKSVQAATQTQVIEPTCPNLSMISTVNGTCTEASQFLHESTIGPFEQPRRNPAFRKKNKK